MSLSFASRSLCLVSSSAVRSSVARPSTTPLPLLAFLSRRSKTDELPQKPIDPYPLPLSHPVSQAPLDSSLAEETDFTIEPLDRSHEDLETTRKRLIYQARKRGMLEGDLLLATFARDRLGSMSKEEVNEFDRVRPPLLSHPLNNQIGHRQGRVS